MKSFMSAALQDTTPVKGATECNSCDSGVKTTGQESATPDPSPTPAPTPVPTQQKENAVVVMQGPLGTAITEALNKSLSKAALQAPVQLPGAAVESFAVNYVQANGQIHNPSVFISKVNKAVGLVPATDEQPTVINTLLDCASKVDDVEFIMVNKTDSDPSAPMTPEKSVIQCYNEDGSIANEEIAIESVQVLVTYRKRSKE